MAKTLLLTLWLLATLLWLPYTWYAFDVRSIIFEYQRHDKAMERVARGRQADPYRYDYYLRAFERARQDIRRTNLKVGFLLLAALGAPGLTLLIGAMVMERREIERRKRT